MDKRKIKINNIITDSIHLLYEKGYNGVGIQEIVESANIPKGSFYAYFKNKEDYLLKSLDFFYSKMEESVLLPLDDKKTKPLNRIHNFFIAEKKSDRFQKRKNIANDRVLYRQHDTRTCKRK